MSTEFEKNQQLNVCRSFGFSPASTKNEFGITEKELRNDHYAGYYEHSRLQYSITTTRTGE